MPRQGAVKIGDKSWYVGTGSIFMRYGYEVDSRCEVLIPVDQIEGMTDSEIGAAVRECIPLARELEQEEYEDWIKVNNAPPEKRQKNKRPIEAGYIYVIQSGQHYKIGRTNNLDRRMVQLGVQMPHPIVIVFTAAVSDMQGTERELHGLFASKRVNGEWFELSDNDLAIIRSHLT